MQRLDPVSFMTSFLVAKADNPNGNPALAALMGNMFGGPPAMRLILTTVLAGSRLANGGAAGQSTNANPPGKTAERSKKAKVKVPHAGNLTEKSEIERHFRDHKLKARIVERSVPGVSSPMVVHQWPERDEEVDEGSVVEVVYLTGGKRS